MNNWNKLQITEDGVGVESFFIKLTNMKKTKGIWLKLTFLKEFSGIKFKVWAILFNYKEHRVFTETFPIEKIKISDDCFSWENGFITFGNNGKFFWNCPGCFIDLSWKAYDLNPMKLLPDFLYSNKIPTTKIVTPYPKIFAEGKVYAEFNDYYHRNFIYENSRLIGMQGHNWGSKHSREYVWMHMNAGMQDITVEGFSTKIFPFKFTSLCVRYNGNDYLFSDVLSPFRIYSKYDPFRFEWNIINGQKNENRVDLTMLGKQHRIPELIYKNPDGSKMLCRNDNLSEIRLQLFIKNKPVVCGDLGSLEFLTKIGA